MLVKTAEVEKSWLVVKSTTHLKSEEPYIGQTKQPPNRRMAQHRRNKASGPGLAAHLQTKLRIRMSTCWAVVWESGQKSPAWANQQRRSPQTQSVSRSSWCPFPRKGSLNSSVLRRVTVGKRFTSAHSLFLKPLPPTETSLFHYPLKVRPNWRIYLWSFHWL